MALVSSAMWQRSRGFVHGALVLVACSQSWSSQMANGDKYTGFWENGFREGEGKCNYGDAAVYDGSWKRGFEDGVGTKWYPDGTTGPEVVHLSPLLLSLSLSIAVYVLIPLSVLSYWSPSLTVLSIVPTGESPWQALCTRASSVEANGTAEAF